MYAVFCIPSYKGRDVLEKREYMYVYIYIFICVYIYLILHLKLKGNINYLTHKLW